MAKRVVAEIEARMGSKRLPGKTLMKLGDKTILEWTVSRLKMCKLVDTVVVATSINPFDDPIAELCGKRNIPYYRGSEDDVLERVAQACQTMSADVVVQAGADCPLYDPDIADELIEIFLDNDYHYVCNDFSEGYPVGVAPHVFGAETLYKINQLATSKRDRENVVTYIWDHPERYKVYNLTPPRDLYQPDIRLTIDYSEDYEFVKEIVAGVGGETFRTGDVIRFVERNDYLLNINKQCKMKKESVAYDYKVEEDAN